MNNPYKELLTDIFDDGRSSGSHRTSQHRVELATFHGPEAIDAAKGE